MTDPIRIGSHQFDVELGDMSSALQVMKTEMDNLEGHRTTIHQQFERAAESWVGPSGDSFRTLRDQLNKNMDDLFTALHSIHHRLKTTHENYLNMEQANATSLTPGPGATVTGSRSPVFLHLRKVPTPLLRRELATPLLRREAAIPEKKPQHELLDEKKPHAEIRRTLRTTHHKESNAC